MTKLLILLLLLATLLYANSDGNNLKQAILFKIASGLTQNNRLQIWSDNDTINKAFRQKKSYQVALTCNEADIIIIEKEETLSVKGCESRNVFVLNYELLTKVPQSFGAFFWKKGRPNIVFIESRIKEQGLTLSEDLHPYIEEKIW